MACHFKEMTIESCINLSLDIRGLVKKNITKKKIFVKNAYLFENYTILLNI